MIEGVDWTSAGFYFAVFSFIFGGIATVLWELIKRMVNAIDTRLTQIEEDIDGGRESRELLNRQIAGMSERQARMEERLKGIPSHQQIADLSREVGQVKAGQEALQKQVGLVVEYLIGKDGEGKK